MRSKFAQTDVLQRSVEMMFGKQIYFVCFGCPPVLDQMGIVDYWLVGWLVLYYTILVNISMSE